MPQLDASFYASQLFWLAVVFILLYGALAFWLLPKIGRVLEERRLLTEGRRAEASQDAEEAESLLASHERALEGARERAREAAAGIRSDAAARIAARSEETRASLEKQIESEEKALDEARDRAQSELREAAALSAREIVEHLTGWKPDEKAARDAVGRAASGGGV